MAGLVLIVSATLMPPFLQQLKGYPVFTTGMVHGAARRRHDGGHDVRRRALMGRYNARLLIVAGLAAGCAFTVGQMTAFTLDVSGADRRGTASTAGLRPRPASSRRSPRSLSPPPSAVCAPRERRSTRWCAISAPASASRSWCRCWRAAPRSTGPRRSRTVALQGVFALWRGRPGADSVALAMWDAEINRQAAMIGYLNDFRAMTICTLIVIPLLFFIRRPVFTPAR